MHCLREHVYRLDFFLVYILVFQTYLYLLQVDAWYYSPYEPWSRFLTGEQGRGPGATLGSPCLYDKDLP